MPPAAVQNRPTGMINMQGIDVPAGSVDPREFMARTRRQVLPQKIFASAGIGGSDQQQLLQAGIISGLIIKVSGNLVVTIGAGTVATTARWPYDFIKKLRFTANGASNLINCSGQKLKARDLIGLSELSDRGVVQAVGGAYPGTSRTQGTLSLSNETWGVGSATTAVPSGTYAVELTYFVPIAIDQRNLVGSIFAQTTATELTLNLDYGNTTDLFVLTGNATVVFAPTITIEAITYSIPVVDGGHIVVPDLSSFHQLVEVRGPALTVGLNEVKLSGQGVGKQLCRLLFQVWNGGAGVGPGAPLPLNATNYAQIGWLHGTNENPEKWVDGRMVAQQNERLFNSDLATLAGLSVLDWISEYAMRDSIDEGLATEIRFFFELTAAVALNGGYVEYVQELLMNGAAAA